jgi:chromosome segregation ATPase
MARMTVSLPDSMLSKVDEQANGLGVPRSQYVLEALEFHSTEQIKLKADIDNLNNQVIARDKELESKTSEVLKLHEMVYALESQLAEATKAKNAFDNLQEEAEQYKAKLEQANAEISQLKSQLDQAQKNQEHMEQSSAEATNLKGDFEQLKAKYDQSLSEATQRWEETKAQKNEITKLKKILDESQATIQHLKDDLLKRQSETDQLAETREELAVTRMEADKLKEAINLRNQDVSFLQGHVSQLTQSISQFALKPGDEEIKKKGWWRFWKG